MNFEDFEDFKRIADDEIIPIFPKDEIEQEEEEMPPFMPLLTLKNMVLFPGIVMPITLGRKKSIKLIKEISQKGNVFGVVSQKNKNVDNPKLEDIYQYGTTAKILKIFNMPEDTLTVILQGKSTFIIEELIDDNPYLKVKVSKIKEIKPAKEDREFSVIIESIKDLTNKIVDQNPDIPRDIGFAMKNIDGEKSFLINFISSNVPMNLEDRQSLLEIKDIKKRAEKLLKIIFSELERLKIKNEIQSKVRGDLDTQQKEYFLQQQMKTIQEELGEGSLDKEIEDMQKKSSNKKWSKEVKKIFEKELSKLQRMNPQVAEYSIQRNYLELFLDLPWGEYSVDNFDLKRAEKILNKHHYGLEKIKKRIIEYLAVLKLKGDMKSPIICFYGPPGVGKTSLGKSIAEALDRKYVRVALGGMRDEAEIRGHRKTYIGAMPGRILQSIKKTKTSNPVFVLDEIDKLSFSNQGDPASAMLEVLDPEQNIEFYDNFLEIGYDLSKVMFIATANDISQIQPALRDRMEMIEINGYTIEEKIEIVKRHLLSKVLKENGLDKKYLSLSKKEMEFIIEGYTRESGIRNIEKILSQIVRSIAVKIAKKEDVVPQISTEDIIKILGNRYFESDKYENNDYVGVVTGLAWTSVGGDILFIESSISEGKGNLSVTGNVGQIMKESATIALEYIKSNSNIFNIDSKIFKNHDIHLHVPEGSTPKDGPSAGITILTSLVSLFTQKKVKSKIAMTGEITLRGKVLPVGGIKEKILAAKRAGITDIILCKDNKKDVDEIPKNYLKDIKFHYVLDIKEVIDIAIIDKKVSHPKRINKINKNEKIHYNSRSSLR